MALRNDHLVQVSNRYMQVDSGKVLTKDLYLNDNDKISNTFYGIRTVIDTCYHNMSCNISRISLLDFTYVPHDKQSRSISHMYHENGDPFVNNMFYICTNLIPQFTTFNGKPSQIIGSVLIREKARIIEKTFPVLDSCIVKSMNEIFDIYFIDGKSRRIFIEDNDMVNISLLVTMSNSVCY